MSHFSYKETYGRNLPHLQPPEATIFVTFRLAGSIPRQVVEQWLREKKQLDADCRRRSAMRQTAPFPDWQERTDFQRRWFARFESLLHSNDAGPLWLGEESIAEIVREALRHRDGKIYRLDAFCIMPNHVHAAFAPSLSEATARKLADAGVVTASRFRTKTQTNSLGYRQSGDDDRSGLDEGGCAQITQTDSLRYLATDGETDSVLCVIMQSLKGYTARKCNLALGRRGAFWQHESFDRVIRDGDEFRRCIGYILNNPVKAGLVSHWRDWKWSYCRPEVEQTVSLLPRSSGS